MSCKMSIAEHSLSESLIRSLLIRERYYRDTAQWDKMRESFHPDASKTNVHIQWYDGDIDGFIAGTRKVVSGKVTTIHSINPTEIDIRGSKALAESFCTMTSRFSHQGLEFDKVSSVRLVSRLENLGSPQSPEWKMLTLDCIYIRDSMIPAAPIPHDRSIIFDGVENYRSSYRYARWLLESIGISVSNDLAGEDDPESVQRVFSRHRSWINES